jgi:hypothetical protein
MNAYPARDRKTLRLAYFRARLLERVIGRLAGNRQLIGSGDGPCSGCPFPQRRYQG